MTNWGNASKIYASIPQDNRRELVTFCQGCWHFTGFQHNKRTIAAQEVMTKLKIDAHRTASGTQGRLKTMSDEEFLIVQAWVNEILTLLSETM